MTISGTFEVGSARIEDMLLVITDSMGTRKIRFGDFTNATGATVNIGNTSTTLGDWLTNAGIDINNLERTTYAESVGVEVPSTQSSSDDTESEVYDATNNSSVAVNLATVDTSQAGNVVVNGENVGKTSSTFPNAPTFTRNGLTIHLLGSVSNTDGDPTDDNGKSLITPLTLDQLTDDQKTIIAGLFKWWGNESLKLAEDSYGIGFDSATAMVKDIGLYFYNGQDNDTLAAVWNWQKLYTDGTSDGSTTQLMLNVNMHYFSGLDASDVDGTANNQSAGMLDRTLAHEFTHAVMGTNIRYFQKLPKLIKEGTAELTHGIDDERGNTIFHVAYDNDWLDSSLVLDNTGTGSQTVGDGYSGGYMFLRYFARRAALQTLFDSGINPLSIVGTEGADSISNTLDGATIQALGGNDSIENEGDSVLIYGDAGDDSINNYGSNVTISGGAGNDRFVFNYSTNGNSGFDVITDYTEGEIIQIKGVAVSSVTAYGNDVTFTAYNNRLIVRNAADKVITYIDSNGTTKTFEPASKLVTLTDGADTYYNAVNGATIQALGGNDTIRNDGMPVSISGGDGNDSIVNDGVNVSIDGGDGDDTIKSQGWHNKINGGAGNDNISLTGDSSYNLIRYTSGDGNDVISGFNATSTLQIGDGTGTYSSQVSGSDIAVTVGDGSILLKDAKGKAININNSQPAPKVITLTEGDDMLIAAIPNVTIDGGDGDDEIYNGNEDYYGGDNVTILGGAGNDTIKSYDGVFATISGGEGDDSIYTDYGSNNFSISGDAGSDTIESRGASAVIDGGDDSDYIYNGTSIDSRTYNNVSISGGDGNDTINNYGGFNVTINGSTGNDYIYNCSLLAWNYDIKSPETVTLDNSVIDGGDGDDTIRDYGASSWINGGGGNDYIYNYNSSDNVTINGGDDDDRITNIVSKVTIVGGAGNDSISNSKNSVMLFGGADNDSIVNRGEYVSISGDAGSDLIVN